MSVIQVVAIAAREAKEGEAELAASSSVFTVSIASLQRLYATDTTPEQVRTILTDELGGVDGLMVKLHTQPSDPALNVFEGVTRNVLFPAIIVCAMGVQAMMVELFGAFANTTGQTYQQWLIDMAFGVGSIVWGVVLWTVWTHVVLRVRPDMGEDTVATTDKHAFVGAHLYGRTYSFRRPTIAAAKSYSSLHTTMPDNAAPLQASNNFARVGGPGSSSRLLSMSARRINPTGALGPVALHFANTTGSAEAVAITNLDEMI
jgi:hypothetical protein